ncbi:hypothetical protein MHAE_17640 [Mycobacterium haemophilum DSM 44634]|uniref:NYN domain-containing protein n=1 Tax=Mycobacterium haemophilum TaxID=29311 RepID=UPI0006551245|nr:NYN domain-containing protein [Mycobacterium haemophilum]AKN15819.1 hypothetical protein B586_03380 [Mycobacterium haemophilum DSM 44634]
MKVGVYVDAFNLYYGMRGHCGRGTAGWRWLDIRALAADLCRWHGAAVERIVYCTAYVDQTDNLGAFADQSVYIKALREHGSIDVLELGYYVAWPKRLPLAEELPDGRAKLVVPSGAETWKGLPITRVTNANDDVFMVTVRNREEKGSDVNVATHLLADIFRGDVEAAIVISNDSDLALPLSIARSMVPVGTVNPGAKPLAGALKGDRNEGPGHHWWRKLCDQDYYNHQMPNPVGPFYRPIGW